MSWKNFLCAAAAAGLAAIACDQAMATNGYQLIGIGQYQMGMTGAVVAAPGDPMTAITNPAGLAWVRPQAAFSTAPILIIPNRWPWARLFTPPRAGPSAWKDSGLIGIKP